MTAVDERRPPMSRAEIGEMRRLQTRDRLIAAGSRVIADLGEDRATIDDFIAEAGVARGTFYNHFATREDLLRALWASIGHDPFANIQAACRSIRDPVERLSAMTRLVLRHAQDEPTWGWLVVALARDKESVNQDLLAYPLPDLKAGEALGLLRYDDAACAVDMVVGTMRSALRAILSEGRKTDYAESVCKMLLLALGITWPDAHRLSRLPLPDLGGRGLPEGLSGKAKRRVRQGGRGDLDPGGGAGEPPQVVEAVELVPRP